MPIRPDAWNLRIATSPVERKSDRRILDAAQPRGPPETRSFGHALTTSRLSTSPSEGRFVFQQRHSETAAPTPDGLIPPRQGKSF